MNEIAAVSNITISKQKKYYKRLLFVLATSIIIGIFYGLFISKSDKAYVVGEIQKFFDGMKQIEHITYSSSFFRIILSQIVFVFLVWFLGISIIGIPLIFLLYVLKGFYFGFSLTSMVTAFGLKGVLAFLTYTFPHQFIFLIIAVLLTFYATHFSVKLFAYLFFHQNVNFRAITKKYSKVLGFSLALSIVGCLFETFISPILLHFMTKLL